MRYFTALCSVQYDKPANNVILSEAEGSLQKPANNVILSEVEGSLKQRKNLPQAYQEILHCTLHRSV